MSASHGCDGTVARSASESSESARPRVVASAELRSSAAENALTRAAGPASSSSRMLRVEPRRKAGDRLHPRLSRSGIRETAFAKVS